MEFILPIVTVCLSLIGSLILINCVESGKYKISESDKSRKRTKESDDDPLEEKEAEETLKKETSVAEDNSKIAKDKKAALIYSVVMGLVMISMSIWFSLMGIDVFVILKTMSLLSVMWPIAFTDFKWYVIPNKFILFGLICRAVIIPIEFVFCSFEQCKVQILSELIASAIVVVPMLLFWFVSKNAIGAGDIKLFLLMGLFLGLADIWNAVFLSLIVAFFVSLFFLITKKKGRKDSVPMGPSIAIGTFLSIIMMGI